VFCLSHPGVLSGIAALIFTGLQTAHAVAPLITPQTLSSGKPQRIEIQMPQDTQVRQLYLSPGGPYTTQSWALPHPGLDIIWREDFTYVAAGAGGLIIIDNNDTSNPVKARLSVGDALNKITLSHEHAWLAAQGGMYTVDVRDPESPRTRAFINTAQAVTALASNEDFTALAQGREIQIFDSRHPGRLQLLTTLPLNNEIHAIAIDQHQLYVAAGKAGVLRYSFTNDKRLLPAGHYHTTGPALDIRVANGIAAVATAAQGLTLLDTRDDQVLYWLGSHQQAGHVQQVQFDQDQTKQQIIILNNQQQLMTLDISNPRMPSMSASLQLEGPITSLRYQHNKVMLINNMQLQQLDFSVVVPQYSNEGLDFGQGVNYGGERRVFIRADIAYVADWFSGIHLYDISNPLQPQLLSSFHTQGSPKGIVVRDDYAYVADDDHGLQIINIRNPRQPFKVSELATPGLAYIPVLGQGTHSSRLYLAGHRGGFQIIDISNPEKPTLIGHHDTSGKTWAIRIRDNIAYIADDDSGLMMFDVSRPDNIQLVGQFSPGGNAEDLILHNNIAYVAFFDRGLYIIDISDPGYPKKLGHLQTPGNARGIARDGNLLYIADWLSGIQVVDVSTPSQPHIIGSYDTVGAAWGVALQNSFAYVMDWWGGFSVLDISRPHKPELAGRYHHRDRIYDISIQGKVAYAANGKAGLQIFDIKNPLNPTWMTGVDFSAAVTHVATSTQRAYVALSDRHISVIDISNPFAAHVINEIRSPYPITDIQLQQPWLLLGHGKKGMSIYRIDGKYADKPRKKQRLKNAVSSTTIIDQQSLATALIDGTIQVYTRIGDKKPEKVFSCAADLLAAHHQYLLCYHPESGISIIDNHGDIISSITLSRPLIDMKSDGSMLYLIDEQQQLMLFDLTNIQQPLMKGLYRILSPSRKITPAKGTLYLSGSKTITALRPATGIAWEKTENSFYTLDLTPDMPMGSYNVHIDDTLLNNAFTLEPPKFSKPKFSMEDLKKAMEKIRQQQP